MICFLALFPISCHLPSKQHPFFLTNAPFIPGLKREMTVDASKITAPFLCAPAPRIALRTFLPCHCLVVVVSSPTSIVCFSRYLRVRVLTNWDPSFRFVRAKRRDAREFCYRNGNVIRRARGEHDT